MTHPSSQELKNVNDRLQEEIAYHREAEAKIKELNRTLEQRVEERTHQLQAVFEAIPEPLLLIDKREKSQLVNSAAKAFCQALGNENELPEKVSQEIAKAFKTGESVMPNDFRDVQCYRIGGRPHYYLCRVLVASLGVIVLLEDVTEFRLLDEIKTDLIGTVSHELKTPVTSIQTSIHLLKSEAVGQLNEEQRELIEVAGQQTDRMMRTLKSLLGAWK